MLRKTNIQLFHPFHHHTTAQITHIFRGEIVIVLFKLAQHTRLLLLLLEAPPMRYYHTLRFNSPIKPHDHERTESEQRKFEYECLTDRTTNRPATRCLRECATISAPLLMLLLPIEVFEAAAPCQQLTLSEKIERQYFQAHKFSNLSEGLIPSSLFCQRPF